MRGANLKSEEEYFGKIPLYGGDEETRTMVGQPARDTEEDYRPLQPIVSIDNNADGIDAPDANNSQIPTPEVQIREEHMNTNQSSPTAAEINRQVFSVVQSGVEAGVAAGAVQTLVDGFVRAFPELSPFAAYPLGRALLSLAIPYALLMLATHAPGIVPGNPELVRRVCLSALQGQATLVLVPVMVKVLGPVTDFVARMRMGVTDPSAVAASVAASSPDAAPAPAPAPAPPPNTAF
jgi:hypothetical protein